MVRQILGISFLLFAIWILQSALATTAHATLKFYYDPLTGNVALDTSKTRSGEIFHYVLSIHRNAPMEFRHENLVRLSNGDHFHAAPKEIADTTFSSAWSGYFTVGDVFPVGLSEEFWTTAFELHDVDDIGKPYTYGYADILGGGTPPPAEFIYGMPDKEFDNRWDIVDPDTLTWATGATLVYRAWSGEVLIDTTGSAGGYISGFRLITESGLIGRGYVPFLDVPLTGVEGDTAYMFADAIEPGIYSLGEILPSALTSIQFAETFADATFLGRAGFNGTSFDFETDGVAMTLRFVPEPSTLIFLVTGLIAGVAVRRRGR